MKLADITKLAKETTNIFYAGMSLAEKVFHMAIAENEEYKFGEGKDRSQVKRARLVLARQLLPPADAEKYGRDLCQI